MSVRVWLSMLTAHAAALRQRRNEEGSVTLEQVVIAAGLLAAAVGLIAVIVAVVTKYAGKIN